MEPSHGELEEVLLNCRYGELEELQAFVEKFGWKPINEVRDENGNTILHMICGNGHLDLLSYVLPHILPELLGTPNTSGRSTPLHWAAMNSHLQIAKALIEHPRGPGPTLIDAHNASGRSPLGEAELAGWEEGAKYFVEVMGIQEGQIEAGEATDTVEMEPEAKEAAKKAERAAQGLCFESETLGGP